jgi:hypothetical protein
MKNENEKILSHKEVEEMLPDYLFERLSEEENKKFEISIKNFPDLEKELEDGKKLFAKIEQFDYKQLLNDKSQYLPEKVVARLEKRNALYQQKSPNYKKVFLFAAMSLGLIIFMFLYNKNENPETNIAINKNQNQINSKQIESSESNIAENNVAENDIFSDEEKEIIAAEILTDENLTDYINNSADFNIQSDLSYLVLLEEIENLDEDSFQQIMENFINEETQF